MRIESANDQTERVAPAHGAGRDDPPRTDTGSNRTARTAVANAAARARPIDDETMNHARKRSRRASSPAWCEDHYGLQLARGSSHIASTLTPATRASAIAEVIEEFETLFGLDDLPSFLQALAQRLENRGAHEASAEVAEILRRAMRKR